MTDMIYYRAFPTSVERTGENQLTGRLIPWDAATDVADPKADGDWDIYREGFRRGAFGSQIKAGRASKISLVHRHGMQGLGFLGPFVALRDMPDGLWGDARIVPTRREDLEVLLDAGINELSIEFRLARGDNTEIGVDGVRWRTRCHLDAVALEPKGAYPDAKVMAYQRAEQEEAAKAQQEQAEREQAAKEQAEREEHERAQAAAAAAAEAAERRAKWDELAGRVDDDLAKQDALLREYGVTKPGGYGSVGR